MRFNYLSLLGGLLLFIGCSKNNTSTDPIPIHETFKIASEHVSEDRVINVWLPEQYASSQDSLPVMYMLDGGIKEDFPHIANTLEKLIKEQKIAPIILVGVENTERRRDLTGVTQVATDKDIAPVVGGAVSFRTFIEKELFLEIDKRYRTTLQKSFIGESLAGLFVVETLLFEPQMFDNYIAFDPSIWWNDAYLVSQATELLTTLPESQKRLWYTGSSATDINVHTKKLSFILKTNAPTTLTWHYSDEPKEEHHTIFRATKEKAIIWTLNPEQ